MNNTVLDGELSMKQSEEDVEEELLEMRNFVFDPNTNINVDALSSYLNANKEAIEESEEIYSVDLSSMLNKGSLHQNEIGRQSINAAAAESN